jgi:hypothetical protein
MLAVPVVTSDGHGYAPAPHTSRLGTTIHKTGRTIHTRRKDIHTHFCPETRGSCDASRRIPTHRRKLSTDDHHVAPAPNSVPSKADSALSLPIRLSRPGRHLAEVAYADRPVSRETLEARTLQPNQRRVFLSAVVGAPLPPFETPAASRSVFSVSPAQLPLPGTIGLPTQMASERPGALHPYYPPAPEAARPALARHTSHADRRRTGGRMPVALTEHQEPGARSQEPGARSQEPRARSQEPGARVASPLCLGTYWPTESVRAATRRMGDPRDIYGQ